MGTSISFPQMGKVHQLLQDHDISSDLLQERLLNSGLIADLAIAIGSGRIPNRMSVRKALGLEPEVKDFKIWRQVSTAVRPKQ